MFLVLDVLWDFDLNNLLNVQPNNRIAAKNANLYSEDDVFKHSVIKNKLKIKLVQIWTPWKISIRCHWTNQLFFCFHSVSLHANTYN